MGHQHQQPESAHVPHTAAAATPIAAMADIDMNNRDPNNINDHLRVTFEDVLAEPEGIHSMNCVWSNSYKCFNCCKDLCYTIMTLLRHLHRRRVGLRVRRDRLLPHLVRDPVLQGV